MKTLSRLGLPLILAMAPAVAAYGYGYGYGRADLDLLTQRVDRMERILRNRAQAPLVLRIQHLEEEVERLRGALETQGHELEGLRNQVRRLYLDLDQRLSAKEPTPEVAPEGGEAPPPAAATQAGQPAAEATPIGPLKPAGPKLKAAYQRARQHLRDGDYAAATTGFEAILQRHPDTDLADNAQYWLGETAYVQRNFADAEAAFQALLSRYPDSDKVPGALLKLGYIHYERRAWKQARQTLERLVEGFPQSTEAHLARRRLQQMRRERH